MKGIFNGINYVLLVYFLICVLVQYNDPDAARWMLMYASGALMCLGFAFKRLHFLLPTIVAAAAFAWAAILAPEVIGQVSLPDLFKSVEMKTAPIELGRELGGLLILGLWMCVLAAAAYSRRSLAG